MSSISSRNSTPFQYSVATGASPGVYHLRAHRLVRGTDTPQAYRPELVRTGLRPVLKISLKLLLLVQTGLRICLAPLLVVLLSALLIAPTWQ